MLEINKGFEDVIGFSGEGGGEGKVGSFVVKEEDSGMAGQTGEVEEFGRGAHRRGWSVGECAVYWR